MVLIKCICTVLYIDYYYRTIMSWDGLYYYYKPEYLDLVADAYNCSGWVPYATGKVKSVYLPRRGFIILWRI